MEKNNWNKLERIQFRCLRFVFNDFNSDYDSLLRRANLCTLTIQRLRLLATEVYKAVHNTGPDFLSDLFVIDSSDNYISERNFAFSYLAQKLLNLVFTP